MRLASVVPNIAEHQDAIARWDTARLDVLFEMDEARRQRKAMQAKADAWARAHRWRVLTAKLLRRPIGHPRVLRELAREAATEHRRVGELKATERALDAQERQAVVEGQEPLRSGGADTHAAKGCREPLCGTRR